MFYKKNNPSAHSTEQKLYTFHADKKAERKSPQYDTKRPPEREMIFGIRAVMEAIDAGKTFDKILLRRDMSSALGKELLQKLSGMAVQVQKVPVERLNQFTDKNHQGVIAFLCPIELYHIEDLLPSFFESGQVPLLMVLDGITDVRNFGAIARTCACAGVQAIIMPTHGSAALNGDAVKTSAGALHTLPVCKVENMQNCLRYLSESGLQIVAATEHTDKVYTDIDFTLPTAIIMGSEEKGIFPQNLELATQRCRIPMTGTIESLNVSVAAGVIIYEALRQRH